MRREALQRWALEFFELHASRSCDDAGDRERLAHAFARELPGVVVQDDYCLDFEEMLGMHATYLEAQHQVAQVQLRDDKRPDGKDKVEHILAAGKVEDLRETVANLRIAVEERFELRCSECGTAPPATRCKMDCTTKKYRG